MFRLFRKTTDRAPKTTRARLGLENLEGRALPAAANYFVLDFTPDFHQGSFADTFYNTRDPRGNIPNFLDFNHDRVVDYKDVQIAAAQVTNRVISFYSPFVNNPANHLTIGGGDLWGGDHLGYNWLKYGLANSSVEVAVMYFGGTNSGGLQIAGRSPQAFDGQNIEGYGETYTRSIAKLLSYNPYATSADFVDGVACAASHELGHMMGLRHTYGNPNSIMSDTMSSTPGRDYFVNGWLKTDNGTYQNDYQELLYSFQTNQRQSPSTYGLGGQFLIQSDAGGAAIPNGAMPGATLPVGGDALLAPGMRNLATADAPGLKSAAEAPKDALAARTTALPPGSHGTAVSAAKETSAVHPGEDVADPWSATYVG